MRVAVPLQSSAAMRGTLMIPALVMGLLSSGCSLIGLGIGSAIPRYSGGEATSQGEVDAPVVTNTDGHVRARFDSPADPAEIKRAVCTLTPIHAHPVAATIEEGGARTRCGFDDVAAQHLDVRLKSHDALSVEVEADRAHDDPTLVVEATKRIQQSLTASERGPRTRVGSHWATGFGFGLAADVLLVTAGLVVGLMAHGYASSWGAGFGSWSGGM